MIRALYTAASGMNAQQANIDTVANNLANVNTAGFKKSRMEFQDLVYQQIDARRAARPRRRVRRRSGWRSGWARAPAATSRDFANGNLRATNAPLDMAIEGRGFFQVAMPSGETAYTRAGSLHLSAEGALVTADGFAIEPQITIPENAVSVTSRRTASSRRRLPGRRRRRRSARWSWRRSRTPRACARSAATSLRRQRPRASRPPACPARRASARSPRASSKTPTSASSRRW